MGKCVTMQIVAFSTKFCAAALVMRRTFYTFDSGVKSVCDCCLDGFVWDVKSFL